MEDKKTLQDVTMDLLSEEHKLEEMARIGYTEDGFEVYINTDDGGDIPHFHYRQGNYGNYTFHTCIRIDEPKYFHHTGKEDVLNSKQRKKLMDFLQSKPKNKRYNTQWERVLSEWNDNNSNVEVDEEQQIPDYTKLK